MPVFQRGREMAMRVVSGETIMMPVRSTGTGPDSIYVLNATGTVIWKALEAPASLEAIADALVAEFDVTREEAETDALGYLESLEKIRLVESVGEKAP
ncbi:MAG: PqqD family protein [Acidobacteria bacterium]|nr:PqqD family protein [Acidobacteriota bacterium]